MHTAKHPERTLKQREYERTEITMAMLKTVQEVLCELDMEKLISTYRWHFPIGYEEHLELLDMTVREIQERVKQGLRLFVERLRTLTVVAPEEGKKGLLFAHRIMKNGRHDRAFELVFMDELLRDGVKCQHYAYEFTEQEVIIGFRVANTSLTQCYIYELVADVMHKASFFGFSQEALPTELEKIKQSCEESQESATKGIPFEEALDELGRRYGFFPDWESEDERELHHEVMRAEMAYSMHSREKELAAILATLQEEPAE